MNTVLKDIFDETMRREKHLASNYNSGKKFQCFFRRNNDNLNERDSMVMYYDKDSPVKAGTLIRCRGQIFLLYNQETIENDVYYKSSVIRINGVINTHSLSVLGLPFYSDTLNNIMQSKGTNISIIDGNAELLTEDCEKSRALHINDKFNEWGRTWQITNLFYIDGICHVEAEISADIEPDYEYRIDLSKLNSLHVAPGDSDKLTATMYINDKAVSDAMVEFKSSNDSVASIDADGNISYLSDGQVYFTATWLEQDISGRTEVVTVQNEQEGDNVTVYMEELPTIYHGFATDINCYGLRGGTRDDSIQINLYAENVSNVSEENQSKYIKTIKITDKGSGKYEILVSNSNFLGKSFDLVAKAENYDAETRQTIKVEGFW